MGANLATGREAGMTAKSNSIITTLKTALTTAGIALATTRRLGWNELAASEFPAVVIEPGPENQSMLNNGQAEVSWLLTLRLHATRVTGLSAADNWREKSALIGRTIAANRQLSGQVIKAEITARQIDAQVFEPWASGTLDLTIRFRFNELTQGG